MLFIYLHIKKENLLGYDTLYEFRRPTPILKVSKNKVRIRCHGNNEKLLKYQNMTETGTNKT